MCQALRAKAYIANSKSDRQEIEELVEQVENERSQVILLDQLADVYINEEEYEKAEIYIVKAIEIDKNKQNNQSLIKDYLKLLAIFEKKETLENNHDIDIVELVNLNEELGEYKQKAVSLTRIAKLESKDDKDKEARQHLQESIEICIQHQYPHQLDIALKTFIEIEHEKISRSQNKRQKNEAIDEAVDLLNKYYEQARQTQVKKIQEPLVRHLLKLYDIYDKREILPRELVERKNCLKEEHEKLKRK